MVNCLVELWVPIGLLLNNLCVDCLGSCDELTLEAHVLFLELKLAYQKLLLLCKLGIHASFVYLLQCKSKLLFCHSDCLGLAEC